MIIKIRETLPFNMMSLYLHLVLCVDPNKGLLVLFQQFHLKSLINNIIIL